MQWKTLRMPREMQGHKFFAAPDGRIAIADWSGHFPHQTEDGVLWLDPSRAMRVWFRAREAVSVVIPLLNEKGEQTATVSDIRTADFAQKVGKMRVETESAELRILVNMFEDNINV
jgi:hypothetical protein